MKAKRVSRVLCFMLVSVLLLTGIPVLRTEAATDAVQLYVAMDGDDAAAGTSIDAPLKTLEGARDKIREMKNNGSYPQAGVVVNIRGGEYLRMGDSFTLDAQDSGTAEGPVIYRAYNNEKVVFSGGLEVEGSKFVPVTDESILARLNADVKDKVLVYDIGTNNGITGFGPYPKNGRGWTVKNNDFELIVDNESQTLSKYPNGESVRFTVVESGCNPRMHENVNGLCSLCTQQQGKDISAHSEEWFLEQEGGIFTTKDTYLTQKYDILSQESELWTLGYFGNTWAEDRCSVEKLEKSGDKLRVTLGEPSYYGVSSEGSGFWFINALCEVDSPGEYYLDRENAKVYYYPNPEKDFADSKVLLGMQPNTLVVMNDVTYVEWQNISFANGNANGIQMSNCEYVEIAGCSFNNFGGRAITLKGNNITIRSCDIANTGSEGVYMDGGNLNSLTLSNNAVINCDISNFAKANRSTAYGITTYAMGSSIIRNRIYDGPGIAVFFKGVYTMIEGNEIYDVCYEASDTGAIYCGRTWHEVRGSVIKNNYVHDVLSKDGVGSSAVYIDDMASGVTITENLFVDMDGRTALIGGGRDNVYTNNILLNEGKGGSLSYGNRGLNWAWASAAGPNGILVQRLNKLFTNPAYNEEAWKTQFPEVFEIDLENYSTHPDYGKVNSVSGLIYAEGYEYYYHNAALPAGGVIKNNITVGAVNPYGNVVQEVRDHGDVDEGENYPVGTDIGFVDAANGNYTVEADSIIKKLMGDNHFNANSYGLYRDEYRTALPGDPEVILTTSKSEYQADEKVDVRLTMTNTGDVALKNIRTVIHIPEGLELESGSLAIDGFSLAQGASKSNDIVLVLSEQPTEAPTEAPTEGPTEQPTEAPTAEPTEAPTTAPTAEPTAVPTEAPTAEPVAPPAEEDQNDDSGNDQNDSASEGQVADAVTEKTASPTVTGDTATPFMWVGLAIVSVAGIAYLCYKNKKAGRRLMSLLLVLTLCAGFMPAMTVEAADEIKLSVTTSVNVDGKDYTITADVYYEEAANKTKLAETLEEANTLLGQAVVGTEPGQYTQESVDTFGAAITAAQMVFDNLDAEQEQVDAAVASLKEAITAFQNSVIVPTVPYTEVNVTDLIAEKDEWNLFEEGTSTYAFQEEPVALTLTSSDSTANKYAKANYLKNTFKNTLFNFKYEAKTIAENGWVGFYIHDAVDNPATFPWLKSGDGVLVVIYKDYVELQIRGTQDYFAADVDKKYTKSVEYMEPDQVYDVTFGMYDESGTEVRIILSIDGEELFNEVIADSDLLSSENYFGTLASPGESSITLGNLSNNGIFQGFYDFDDFNTNRNWSVKGEPTRSSEQAYTGLYSYKLDEDQDSIRLNKTIQDGNVVSVMLYDSMDEKACAACVVGNLYLGIGGGGIKEYYTMRNINAATNNGNGADQSTGVERSEGWHELKWDFSNGESCVLSIDGNKVAEFAETSYSDLFMGDIWGSKEEYVPAVYFDDLKIGKPKIKENVVSIIVPEEEKTVTLDKAGTSQINAKAESNPDVNVKLVYTSADTNVATVDENGLITAVGVGETTITIQSKKSTDENPVKTVVNVTVTESTGGSEEPQVSINVESTDMTVLEKGGTAQINAMVTNLPEGTQATLEYTPAEGTNAMISKNGLITGVTAATEAETLTTTITAKDSSGAVLATKEVSINVTISENTNDVAYYGFSDPDFTGFNTTTNYTVTGTPTRTMEQAYSGLYSYKVDEGADSIRMDMNGTTGNIISVMMYDNMDTSTKLSAGMFVNGDANGLAINGGISTTHYSYRGYNAETNNYPWYTTSVERSLGWHELKMDFSNGTSCVLYIDNIKVGEITQADLNIQNYVFIGDRWANTDGYVCNIYFDDLKIEN